MIPFASQAKGALGAIAQLDRQSDIIVSGFYRAENEIEASYTSWGNNTLRWPKQLQYLQP